MNKAAKPRLDEAKYVFCGFGRAAELAIGVLVRDMRVPAAQILCFSYDGHIENSGFLNALGEYRIVTRFEPLRSSEAHELITAFKPDVLVSMHHRDRIPSSILSIPALGGVNLHPSLLPKYRGCFSAPWAIINQEIETGITYHFMNDHFDDGNIILQKRLSIEPSDTGYSLFHKLIDLGVRNLAEAMYAVVVDGSKGEPQRGEKSYFRRQVPYHGMIDPTWDERRIDAFIRALEFPGKPGANLQTRTGCVEIRSIDQYRHLAEQETL